jgi:hypothetical protein
MYLHHDVQTKQGNGNGWFGPIYFRFGKEYARGLPKFTFGKVISGGCEDLNSLSQRSALFDFYDSAGGDEWLRSKVRVRVLYTVCSFGRSRVRVRVRGESESESES